MTSSITVNASTGDDAAPITKKERIGVIDVLRGFALFGILMVNMAAFKAPVIGGAGNDGILDQAALWVIAFGFQTKFYVLFSFLFGYGLSVQMERAAARGTPFVPRFLRRLLGLLLLGLAHAMLLYTGDILVTYALLGVVLLLLRNRPPKVLLRVAVALVAVTTLVLAAFGVLILTSPGDLGAAAAPGAEVASSVAAYLGTPAEVIRERVREYPGTLAFALFGQGPTALAMFLVGLLAGRRRLLEHVDDNQPLLRQVLATGLAVGVPGALVWATFQAVNGFIFNAAFFFASAVDFATAPFLSAVYVTTIMLLYRTPVWRRRLAPLAPLGRMALSNYLFQSLVGALLFTGYGLGLYGRVGAALGVGLSLGIFALQLPLSDWWLRWFQFGPAEWLLRSFTYARLQPLRIRTNEPQVVAVGEVTTSAESEVNAGAEERKSLYR